MKTYVKESEQKIQSAKKKQDLKRKRKSLFNSPKLNRPYNVLIFNYFH